MRTRRLIAALAGAGLLATACGGTDTVADDTATGAPTATDAPSEGPTEDGATDDASDHEADGGEGEPRDEDAIFGVAVCDALVPVVLGRPDEFDRYAAPYVLDLLAPEPGFEPLAEDVSTWEDDDNGLAYQTCNVSAGGDAWFEIALLGDGHVGHTAVGAVLRSSYDTPEDVELALDELASSGEVCDGQQPTAHELFNLAGTYVAMVTCEFFAYQGLYQPLFWSGFDLRPMSVETWFEGEITEQSFLVGFPIAEDSFGTIENIDKARGPGDCGIFSVWFVGDDLSLDLGFVTERRCEDSDGNADPYAWEQVYSAAG